MSMEILIYEDDEQVGSVDLDAETSTYDGTNADVERVLTKMETEGYTHRVPLPRYTDEQGRRVKGSKREKRTGAGLGRYLLGVLEEKGRDDEVRTEAIGFDREYPMIKVGEYPESEESTGEGDQSKSIDPTKETSNEPTPSNPNAN